MLWADATGDDVTLCFISSQNVTNLSPEEFILDASEPDFAATGLRISSKVRVTRIITIERRLITRRIGKLSATQIHLLNTAISQAFQLA